MKNEVSLEQARAAKGSAKRLLAGNGNVVGIGITRLGEGFGLKVNLQAEAGDGDALPAEIEGVPVKVEVIGRLRPRRSTS